MALITRRLSGSQVNGTGVSGRSETGGCTAYGGEVSVGNTQNSGCCLAMTHAPILEPSGEKWIVDKELPSPATEARGYGTGDAPGGDDKNSVGFPSSGVRKKA